MKKIFMFLGLVLLLTGCAPTKFIPIARTETVNVTGTKSENFVKANLWLVDIFNSAKSVVQFSDKEAGVIKGKYLLYYSPEYDVMTRYATITITADDNKLSMSLECNEPPYMFYPAQKMNADINGLFYKFQSSFQK